MDIEAYDEIVRSFHRNGYSWKESQRKADAKILVEKK